MTTGDKELRLALGMRGGVSLAIWIGGACAEIDRLRRAGDGPPVDGDHRPDAPFWRDLLDHSDYSNVIVDVIAGASAGGLNGVLFATSQHYGYDLDQVRDLWLRVGALQKLIRTEGPNVSLLDADGGFLAVLQEHLQQMIAGVQVQPPAPRVDMQLSATLVEPIDRPAPSTEDEQLRDTRYMTRFHFAHEPRAAWTSDFPERGSGAQLPTEVVDATWRWALAGRSTSSFPAAFEPAFVRASRRSTFGDDQASASTDELVDMRGVFAEARGSARTGAADADDFLIADGGILDNIPLGKALRAIADATADRPTRRYLVYLHPTGPTGGVPETDVATPPVGIVRRSLGTVLTGVVGSRLGAETTLGDIAQMEAHNRAARRAAALRDTSFSRLPDDDGQQAPIVRSALTTLARYRQERSLGDARAIEALLDDPVAGVGGDPFPSTVGGTPVPDDCWRAPLAGWSAAARQDLSGALITEFDTRIADILDAAAGGSDPDALSMVFTAGTGPLERVVRLMIGWARCLDQRQQAHAAPGSEPAISAGDLRQQLYDVLAFVRRNLATPRDLGWVTLAALAPRGASWGDPPVDAVDRIHRVDAPTAALICDELTGQVSDDAARRGHADDLCALLDGLAAGSIPGANTVDLRTEIVDRVLVPIAAALASIELPPSGGEAHDPAVVLDAALSTPTARTALATGAAAVAEQRDARERGTPPPAGSDADIAGARNVLAAAEVLCYQEFLDGAPGSEISFVRMSAANRTPLAKEFETLRDAGTDEELTDLTPDRKLAGNTLKNFAAFAKEEWRANDWMWGRLDATATLVDLLVTEDSVGAMLADEGPHGAMTAVEHLVTGNPLTPAWGDWLRTDVWEQRPEPGGERRCDTIAATLATFPASTDGTPVPDAVTEIRSAVLARRQWEILAEEFAKPANTRSTGADGPLDPETTRRRAKEHRVGKETFTDPRSFAHASLFWKLSKAGDVTLARTVQILSDRESPEARPAGRARWAGKAVRWGGRATTVALLVPRWAIAAGAAGVAAVVAGAIVIL
jgi:patatin-related protein